MKKTIKTGQAKVTFNTLHYNTTTCKNVLFVQLSMKIEIGDEQYNTAVQCRADNRSKLDFVPILTLNANTEKAIYDSMAPTVHKAMDMAFTYAATNKSITRLEKTFELDTEEAQEFIKSLMIHDMDFRYRVSYNNTELLPWQLEEYYLEMYKLTFKFDKDGKNIPEYDWIFLLRGGNEEEDELLLKLGSLDKNFEYSGLKGPEKIVRGFIESVIPLQEMIKQDISVPAPFMIQW